MNITLRRQPRWRIEIEGRDDAIETEDLTPVNMTVLGGVIAQRVHEGADELQLAIKIAGGVDHHALNAVRDYIETVHDHALRVRTMKQRADDAGAFEGVPHE